VSALPTRGNNTNHNYLRQLELAPNQSLSRRGGCIGGAPLLRLRFEVTQFLCYWAILTTSWWQCVQTIIASARPAPAYWRASSEGRGSERSACRSVYRAWRSFALDIGQSWTNL